MGASVCGWMVPVNGNDYVSLAPLGPGDALFVPAQWEYATLSLADSVAVAAEFV